MKKLENEYLECWIENDGILYSKFKYPIDMKLDIMKSFIELRHELSEGKHQYWCYIANGVKSYPKESRDYSAIHGQDYLHACACVVSSHITKFIFNAFSKINKPRIPFKAFKSKEAAVEWLLALKKQNEAKGIH
jgi:hypothetical protein